MLDRTLEPTELSFIDSLIADCQPTQKALTFSIKGRSLRFRLLTDASEMQSMQEGAEAFAKSVSFASARPEMEGLTPCDPKIAKLAFVLAELSQEPKLTHLDALKMARRIGAPFLQIMESIDTLSAVEIRLEEASQIESLKNALSETSEGETD